MTTEEMQKALDNFLHGKINRIQQEGIYSPSRTEVGVTFTDEQAFWIITYVQYALQVHDDEASVREAEQAGVSERTLRAVKNTLWQSQDNLIRCAMQLRALGPKWEGEA